MIDYKALYEKAKGCDLPRVEDRGAILYAISKQIPQRVEVGSILGKERILRYCPSCGVRFLRYGHGYCGECGQALDWSDAK